MKDKVINFIKMNKLSIILALIIVGAYLRLNDFENLMRFNDDQVRDAQIVDAMFEEKEFPLLGPKAGGTGFKLGPAFYYLQYLSGLIFGHSPSGIALFVPILAIASIPLLFCFLRLYFSENISLGLTFLYSVSFYAIKYSRFAWNPNIILFFLLIFLISTLKYINSRNQKINIWVILLALSAGISIQLHTTLLVIVPIVTVFVFIFLFIRNKKISFSSLLLTLIIILILNAPVIVYEFQNKGKNTKSFFEGTQKKTEKNYSILMNILNEGQFFIQGNIYTVTGFEPQKNWLNPKKLFLSKNSIEIAAAILGTILFFLEIWWIIEIFKQEKDVSSKYFLGLILYLTATSFVLFIPIANELNLRFFIILIPAYLVFLGVFIQVAMKNLFFKNINWLIFFVIFLLTYSNLFSYKNIYNLDDYSERSSAYGGISLKEAEAISDFMFYTSQKYFPDKDARIYLAPFSFDRSIKYLNEKKGMETSNYSEKSNKLTEPGSLVFLINETPKIEKNLEEYACCFENFRSENIGRFSIYALRLKKTN